MKELTKETEHFIATHLHDDVRQLALKAACHPDVDMTEAVIQIAGRQTAEKKSPHVGRGGGDTLPRPPLHGTVFLRSHGTAQGFTGKRQIICRPYGRLWHRLLLRGSQFQRSTLCGAAGGFV